MGLTNLNQNFNYLDFTATQIQIKKSVALSEGN